MNKTKYIIHITMFTLWLFACVGQPVITILEDGKSLVTNNISEEEQKEQQGKKNNEEEKKISNNPTDLLFASNAHKSPISDIYIFGHSNHLRQIIVPPPESFI